MILISYAEYEDSELEGYVPTIVHVDRANRPITAELLAATQEGPAPHRYVEVDAG